MSKVLKIVPLRVEHFDLMDMRQSELDRLAIDPQFPAKLAALAQHGKGGCIFYDGRVLGVIGYVEMWPGMLDVWAFPSIYVKQYAMIYLRTAKRYLRLLEETLCPFRIQTTAIDDALHTRWMEFLGFQRETPNGMRNYTNNRLTMNMWAKTYEVA